MPGFSKLGGVRELLLFSGGCCDIVEDASTPPPEEQITITISTGEPYAISNAFTGSHTLGTHWHAVAHHTFEAQNASDPDVIDESVARGVMEVGGFFGDESIRGLIEIPFDGFRNGNIISATLQFQVGDIVATGIYFELAGLFGQEEPGPNAANDGTLMDVLGYLADGTPSVDDYTEDSLQVTIDTIDTDGAAIDDTFQVDVKSFLQTVADAGGSYAGFRIQPGSDMDDDSGALPFDRFVFTIVVADSVYNADVLYWGLDRIRGDVQAYMLNGKARLTDWTTTGSNREIQAASVLDLDGVGDYVSVADHADFDFTTNLSGSIWAKSDGASANATLLGKYQTTGDKREFALILHSDSKVHLFLSSDGTAANTLQLVSDNTYTLTEWAQYGWTYDGDAAEAKVFRNGAEIAMSVAAGSVPSSLNNDDEPVTMGAINTSGTATGFYNGKLSSGRLYNVTLTPTQMAELGAWPDMYTATETGLVAHWTMTDQNGLIVQNRESNAKHGAITVNSSLATILATDKTCPSADWPNVKGFTGARRFDGSTGYLTAGSALNAPTTSWQATVWFNVANTGSLGIILDGRDAAGDGPLISRTAANKIAFQVDANTITSANSYSLTANPGWHKLVVGWNGTNLTMDIDDGTDVPTPVASATWSTTTALRVGARSFTSATSFFQGLLKGLEITRDGSAWSTYLKDQEYTSATATVIDEVSTRHLTPTATSLARIPVGTTADTDIRGLTSQHTGRVPRSPIANSPVWTGDGVGDYASSASLFDAIKTQTTGTVVMRIHVPTDPNRLYTLWSVSRNADATRSEIAFVLETRSVTPNDTLYANCRVDGSLQWEFRGTDNSFDEYISEHILVALVQDGTEPAIYINGLKLTGSFAVSTDKTKWINDIVAGASSPADVVSIAATRRNGAVIAASTARIAYVNFFSDAKSAAELRAIYQGTDNETNLVARYRGNHGGGDVLHDDSGNENHALITVNSSLATIWGQKGPTDISIVNAGCSIAHDYDGTNDYITGPEPLPIPTSSFEVEVWVLHRASGSIDLILDGRDGNNDGFRIWFDSSNKFATSIDATTVASVNTYTDNKWHKLVVTWDGVDLAIDIDDGADTNSSATGAWTANGTNFRIGEVAFTTGFKYVGLLRGLKITNDGAEWAHYRDGNEIDHSGNGRDGTVTGSLDLVTVPGAVAVDGPTEVTHQYQLVAGQKRDYTGGQANSYYTNYLETLSLDPTDVAAGTSPERAIHNVRTQSQGAPTTQPANDDREVIMGPNRTTEEEGKVEDYTSPNTLSITTSDDLSDSIDSLRGTPNPVLILAPGTYTDVGGMSIDFKITVKAQDPNDRPIIQPSSGDRCLLLYRSGTSGDPSDSRFENIIFDGTNVTYDSVKVEQWNSSSDWIQDVTFDGCDVLNGTVNGLLTAGRTRRITFTNGLVDVTDQGHGLYLSGPESTVSNSTISNCAQWGVHMFSAVADVEVFPDQCTIDNCTIFDNGHTTPKNRGYGAIIQEGDSHTHTDNTYYGNLEGGLQLNGVTNVTTTGNTYYDSGTRPSDGETHAAQFPITEVNTVTYAAQSDTTVPGDDRP